MLVVCHIVTSELIGALSTQFSDNAHIGSMHEFLWQCKGTGIFIPIAVTLPTCTLLLICADWVHVSSVVIRPYLYEAHVICKLRSCVLNVFVL